MKRSWMMGAAMLLLALCAPFFWPAAPAASAASPYTEYTVDGNPKNVAIDAAGNVWFTLPEADKIGVLQTGTATYYPTGAGSKPYDLVVDNNVVWFTMLGANQIGRLNTGTGTIQQYSVPTANSEPTGITIGGGGVWFVERKGDNLGKLDPASGAIDEYTDKSASDGNLTDMTGAELEDVAYGSGQVWFTGPSFKTSVAYYVPATGKFQGAPAGASAQPMQIVIDNLADVWITAKGINRIGRFGVNTLGLWNWYDLPAGSGGPTGLAFRDANGRRELWYTRPEANRVGRQLALVSGGPAGQIETVLPLANGVPWGVAVDANGTVWIAASGAGKIAAWSSPYFEYATSLPFLRQQPIAQ